MEDLLKASSIYALDPLAQTINVNVNFVANSPGTQIAQAEGDSAAVAGNDSQAVASGGRASKGSETQSAGSGKWIVVVALLLVGVAGFGALYLTDTIKLGEASIGVGFVAVLATILGLLK